MIIKVTREAVCPADDQFEPLELILEFGAEATLEDFANRLSRAGFLHFSSTHHTVVSRSLERLLLKIRSRWGSLAVEYLLAADTKLAAVVAADATIDFRFDRACGLRPLQIDLESRRPVWLALSDMFLDTDLFRESNTRLLAATPYSLDELDAILREEVYPACSFNLSQVAGEWAGFDADWLERRILLEGRHPGPGGVSWDVTSCLAGACPRDCRKNGPSGGRTSFDSGPMLPGAPPTRTPAFEGKHWFGRCSALL